jgi:hypothetical protein
MSLFTWFRPQVSTLKQNAVEIEYLRNSLNHSKQSKTEPLLQGIMSLKIIKNQFFEKGNLRLNVTFHVVSSVGLYTQAKSRSNQISAKQSESL